MYSPLAVLEGALVDADVLEVPTEGLVGLALQVHLSQVNFT